MAKENPEFQLYNSLTKQKETFKSKFDGKVGMYICGVTSYDLSDIGRARAYIAFDVLCRYLKYLGYEVDYVRNCTGVVDKVTKLYHPLALRYFLLRTHYRSAVNYSISEIEIASVSVFYLYQTLERCERALLSLKEEATTNAEVRIIPYVQEWISKLHNEFEAKMSDDLQTPTILSAIQDALRCMNGCKSMLNRMHQNPQKFSVFKALVALEKEVKQALDVLGLLSSLSYSEVLQQLKDKALERACLTEEDISHSIEERMLALKNNDFSRGAEIRSDLGAKGIALMDIGNETIWRPNWPAIWPEGKNQSCILTHSGCNSTIVEEVSLVCCPLLTNCRKWDIRLEIEGEVSIGKVDNIVRVMRKEAKGNKALERKEKDHLADKKGGSSYINLEKLINETLLKERN